MDFNKCSRCGSFYVAEGQVCPKCAPKDGFEFSTFKSYVEEHGISNSLDTMAAQTGISTKNLGRYIQNGEFETASNGENVTGFNGVMFN